MSYDSTKSIKVKVMVMLITGLMFAGPALAGWIPGDGHKMHWPQLPDPIGLDVDFEDTHMLADDWTCTATGPVEDIHFWVSHKGGVIPILNSLHVEIYSNTPATATSFGMPNQKLWEGTSSPYTGDFDLETATGGSGDQGWYDPYTPEYIPSDHDSYFQINLTNMRDPFIQEVGEMYWLAISIDTSNADGWKTSQDHYASHAVYLLPTGGWAQLEYPPEHPNACECFSLAFVITPEPATIFILTLGGLVMLRTRRVG